MREAKRQGKFIRQTTRRPFQATFVDFALNFSSIAYSFIDNALILGLCPLHFLGARDILQIL
jgi:hypothetical protein